MAKVKIKIKDIESILEEEIARGNLSQEEMLRHRRMYAALCKATPTKVYLYQGMQVNDADKIRLIKAIKEYFHFKHPDKDNDLKAMKQWVERDNSEYSYYFSCKNLALKLKNAGGKVTSFSKKKAPPLLEIL